jgi:hypothetical protein
MGPHSSFKREGTTSLASVEIFVLTSKVVGFVPRCAQFFMKTNSLHAKSPALHHTDSIWQALENVAPIVKPVDTLFIAIHKDQGKRSRRWRSVKQIYNRLPANLRFLVLWPAFLRMWWKRLLKDALAGWPFDSFWR